VAFLAKQENLRSVVEDRLILLVLSLGGLGSILVLANSGMIHRSCLRDSGSAASSALKQGVAIPNPEPEVQEFSDFAVSRDRFMRRAGHE
jgi:hypothetical protein